MLARRQTKVVPGHGFPKSVAISPPVIAAGNANGDPEMTAYCEASGQPFLNILLQHDDAEREYACSHGAERIQSIASERGWVTVSMKQDFETVFKLAVRPDLPGCGERIGGSRA